LPVCLTLVNIIVALPVCLTLVNIIVALPVCLTLVDVIVALPVGLFLFNQRIGLPLSTLCHNSCDRLLTTGAAATSVLTSSSRAELRASAFMMGSTKGILDRSAARNVERRNWVIKSYDLRTNPDSRSSKSIPLCL
jgi:hypothetical protein